jgi:hypothetical protein
MPALFSRERGQAALPHLEAVQVPFCNQVNTCLLAPAFCLPRSAFGLLPFAFLLPLTAHRPPPTVLFPHAKIPRLDRSNGCDSYTGALHRP